MAVALDPRAERITPREAAVLLMANLERRGAVFAVAPDGYLHANLDAIADPAPLAREHVAAAILALRDDIKALILARRTVH